jgi:anti-sigma regulatory factor (Ser/Thr protein kinase)
MPGVPTEEVVLAASELGHNQLRHARRGSMGLRTIARDGVAGIEVIAADTGAGIADPERALHGDRTKLQGSLGVGLAAALRQADEMDFDVRLGEGTAAWARKFAGPVESRPVVGIFGQAIPGETEMGDAAMFTRADGVLTLALIDGVGHGPEARAAALMAASVARAEAHRGPEAAVRACDDALADGRGAVMTVAHIDGGSMELASVGNIVTRLCRPRFSQSFRGESRVLGQRGARRKITVEQTTVVPGDVVMLFTDGLKSDANLAEDLALMREHPLLMAHHLFAKYRRGHDDALVAVIRV